MDNTPRALLVDMTRCIGCRACVAACKEAHDLPGDESDTVLSATAYTAMVDRGDLHIRKLCMHCVTPSCASVCPVAALRKTAAGPVVYESSRCIGCRYCMLACPFSVPRYEWNQAVPSVRKCDLCVERLARGEIPACAAACPVEATVAGSRDELLAEAHRRITDAPGAYFPHVYGETELGGTSVLFLSPVSFASLGFPQGLGEQPLPDLTWEAQQRVPGIVILGGAALLAVYWITHRREEVVRAEGERPAQFVRQAAGKTGTEDEHGKE
jgi:formate dehydrogenase iron-sulfur subunit